MGDYRAQIECDGGPNCQAREHIEGCFATERRYVQVRPGEVEALREQLRGAVEERDRLRAGISWARGMLTDEEPPERIDAYLGSLLSGGVVDDPRLIETLARVIENRHGTLHGIGSTLREALAEYKRGQ